MAADERTREATDSADDILGAAGALAARVGARTGARRGRGKAAAESPIVPTVSTSPASTAARTEAPVKTVQRSFYVDPVEWRAVQLAALNEGVTASEIVRRAIRAALDVGDTT